MSLSINDGKTTPVAHVFTQDAQQNGSDPAEFVNRSNPNGPNFQERINGWVTLGRKGKGSQPHTIKLTMIRPIPGTDVNGNPIVVGVHKGYLTLLVDQNVTAEADVLDSFVMLSNLGSNSTIRGQAKQFAPFVA